jgi:hypothetical protein
VSAYFGLEVAIRLANECDVPAPDRDPLVRRGGGTIKEQADGPGPLGDDDAEHSDGVRDADHGWCYNLELLPDLVSLR